MRVYVVFGEKGETEAGSCTHRGSPKQFLFLKIAAALPTWTWGEINIRIRGMHSNEERERGKEKVKTYLVASN